MTMTTQQRPITLLVCALGGEGGGVLTDWLTEAARLAGFPAQATSIPGVAQRTGATTYYIELYPVLQSELGGRRPVFSLSPVPGALDALVSSELLETARQVSNGMTAPDRTLVLSSSARLLTTQERMQLGDGRAETEQLLGLVRRFSREHQVFDMNAMAKANGTVVSAVLLGAIAGSGLLPIERRFYEQAIGEGGASAQASRRGFDAAFARVRQAREQASFVEQLLQPAPQPRQAPAAPGADWPEPVREMAALGEARLVDYQGPAYARLYVQRLQQVLQAERAANPSGAHGWATTREMARWLALWMAFDDIVRVADLKSRQTRWQRVAREVQAGDTDLLKLYDHFKPGAPEFAALLPQGLAERVLAWDRKRVAAGKEPWALPLKIGTHTVGGMLALRLLAGCRWLRVHGSRFAAEQAMLQRWLDAVVQGTARDWRLGHELALCGRLIKGYGATNERGKENLLHVLQLATGAAPDAAASAVAAVREAALADDAGKAFDAALVRHGAAPRPVKAQPIRFVRQPRGPRVTPDGNRA